MNEALRTLSDELAAAVVQAGASVLQVDARQRLAASGVAWSADGVVVTAHHVLEQEDGVTVGTPDGASVPARLVGRDPSTDIAVLRAEGATLTPASWADPEVLRVGHLVLALGRPGKTVQATLGIASAIGDAWRTPMGGHIDRYVQPDVVMYPGFSGGPLVDAAGGVIGVNSSALRRAFNVTVPAATVRCVVETLLAHGRIQRGYLGVGAQPARLPAGLVQRLDQETGLLVVSVETGSPADAAGILLGDTIVALDGQSVRHLDDLLAALPGELVGKGATVRMVRGGEVREMAVTVGERRERGAS